MIGLIDKARSSRPPIFNEEECITRKRLVVRHIAAYSPDLNI